GSLRVSGFFAWLVWLVVHIYYLIDFRNRLLVLIDWTWAYFAYARGARLITHERAGSPLQSAPADVAAAHAAAADVAAAHAAAADAASPDVAAAQAASAHSVSR